LGAMVPARIEAAFRRPAAIFVWGCPSGGAGLSLGAGALADAGGGWLWLFLPEQCEKGHA
jgi:hypothetical protein